GTVFYKGNDISDMDTITLRKEVLLVSQAVFLFDGTIAENFLEYYKYRDVSPLPENDFRKYLDICCADFPSDSRCETMSGGERQRIFTAICLSFKPKVLMLDEPTSALDQATARTFFQNVKEFCKSNGITIITISHDENLVDTFADKKIYLEKRLNS
ncbi:MAG: ATP-binding cassette domain-containing protein, partial [Oscillospiraceae bacterium]